MENRSNEPGVGGFAGLGHDPNWPPKRHADGRPLFYAVHGHVYDVSGKRMSPETCAHERDCAAAGAAAALLIDRPAVAHAWRLYGGFLGEAVDAAAAQRRNEADWTRSIVRGVLYPRPVGLWAALSRWWSGMTRW